MRILHVITGLEAGGAEATLCRLVTTDRSNRHEVVSLTGSGHYAAILAAAGVPVHTLDMNPVQLSPRKLLALGKIIRKIQPDLVQTWLYHADLIGGLAAGLAGSRAVCWSIRNGNISVPNISRRTRFVVSTCALLSRYLPSRIVSCSVRAANVHTAAGYDAEKIEVIPNGYDLTRFRPDLECRRRIRSELGLAEEAFVTGMIGRWDTQKDHGNLIRALQLFANARRDDWACLLVGHGMDHGNPELVDLLKCGGVYEHCRLLGLRPDVPNMMNVLDVHVLSSSGEAFPNVVAEAMACGVPAIVTDVGDAADIVGDTGWIVPARDADALAAAIRGAEEEWRTEARWGERRRLARERIVERYSIDRMVAAYQTLWSAVIDRVGKRK